MHILDFLNRSIAIRPVVVHPQVVWRVAGDLAHEVRDPGVARVVACAGRADELVALVSQWQHLAVPGVRRLLRGDAIALRLVEEVDDTVLGRLNDSPIVPRELPSVVDHGSERCAAFELRRGPGVPVTDGVRGAVKVDLVHLAGAVVGVGIVPEQASFLSHVGHGVVCCCFARKQSNFCDRMGQRCRIDWMFCSLGQIKSTQG